MTKVIENLLTEQETKGDNLMPKKRSKQRLIKINLYCRMRADRSCDVGLHSRPIFDTWHSIARLASSLSLKAQDNEIVDFSSLPYLWQPVEFRNKNQP